MLPASNTVEIIVFPTVITEPQPPLSSGVFGVSGYDPFLSPANAEKLAGVKVVDTLDEVGSTSLKSSAAFLPSVVILSILSSAFAEKEIEAAKNKNTKG